MVTGLATLAGIMGIQAGDVISIETKIDPKGNIIGHFQIRSADGEVYLKIGFLLMPPPRFFQHYNTLLY